MMLITLHNRIRLASVLSVLALTTAAILPSSAGAQQIVGIDLDLVADPQSRWHDGFSDTFGQVDGGPLYAGGPGGFDGFYLTSAINAMPPTFSPVGTGVTVFPLGASFGDVGEILIDISGLTGVGVELAPVTGVEIDWAQFIADDDAIVSAPYLSAHTVLTGDATYVDGVLDDVELDSTVVFTYDGSGFGQGLFDFTGSFGVTAGSFALDCSCPESYTVPPFSTPVGFTWDVTGTAVPEPSTTSGIVAGAALLARLAARRRRH